MRDFRRFEIWQLGIDLAMECYSVTKRFPDSEKFGLSSQLRRACVSIPSNVAEGCARKSDKEFSRYLEISLGSAFEVETQFIIANKLGYIDDERAIELFERSNKLQRKIGALISTLISS